jgi:outer membrane protein assembly factor BamA
VIRREVSLREGATFKLSRAVTTQERLFDLGLFRSVRILPSYREPEVFPGRDPEVTVDLNVAVTERQPGWYGLGFGITSANRMHLLGEVGYRNLHGRARGLQFSGEISWEEQQELNRNVRRMDEWGVELVYSEPWIWGLPIRWQVRTSYRFTHQPTHEQETYGIFLRGRRELSRFRSVIGTIRNDWTSERREEYGESPETSDFVTRSVSLRLVEDRRDFILDPHRGHVSQVTAEYAGLGGEATFIRGIASYARYVPLGRRFTWAYRVRAGHINPVGRGVGAEWETNPLDRVPWLERFFAGGGTTVRGYREDVLGPEDESGQPTGGLTLVLANAELRFWLSRFLGGAIFLDAGNVWDDNKKIKWSRWTRPWTRASYSELDVVYAIGAGMRFATPIGPLRLDYGRKLSRAHRDKWGADAEWHLSLGQAF